MTTTLHHRLTKEEIMPQVQEYLKKNKHYKNMVTIELLSFDEAGLYNDYYDITVHIQLQVPHQFTLFDQARIQRELSELLHKKVGIFAETLHEEIHHYSSIT